MGFLSDGFELMTDPLGFNERQEQNVKAEERQRIQFQAACGSWRTAAEALDAGDYEKATAAALVGILSLQLSET